MIYRKFGNTGIEISQLGFGCMRFPLKDSYDPKSIDEIAAEKMLRYAIDNGVNYLDTAYPYHRKIGEPFLGKILRKGLRDKVYLATKMPIYLIKSEGDVKKYFNEQLKRLQTDMVDMYLLHALNKKLWDIVKENDIIPFVDRMRERGKVRFLGFSFHDELPLFKEIVDSYPWTFCLIQLNYVDNHFQAGLEGMKYAYSKGLVIIVMEPLRGGKLAGNVPLEVQNIIKETGRKQTAAEFALRWVLNHPEVSCVLSGMSTMEQMQQNINFTSREHRDTLTDNEMELYRRAKKFFKSRTVVDCTQCGYCTPCPEKVEIPFILELYNDAFIYDVLEQSRRSYSLFVKPEHRADKCIECGECEEKCPRDIPISNILKKAHHLLAPKP